MIVLVKDNSSYFQSQQATGEWSESLVTKDKAWLGYGMEALLVGTGLWLLWQNPMQGFDGLLFLFGVPLLAAAILFPVTLPSMFISLELVFTFYFVMTADLATVLWVNAVGELVGELLMLGRSRKSVLLVNPALKVIYLAAGYLVYSGVESLLVAAGLTYGLAAIKLFTVGTVFFLVNHLLLNLNLYLRTRHFNLGSCLQGAKWDSMVFLAVFPLAYLGYVVQPAAGIYSLLIIALPVGITAYLIRAYNNLHWANRINQSCMKLSTTKDLTMIYQKTFQLAQRMTDSPMAMILKRQENGMFQGIDAEGRVFENLHHSLFDDAASTHDMTSIQRAAFSEQVLPGWDAQSLVLLPLIGKTEVFGLICLGKRNTHGFKAAHRQQLGFLANQVSIILDRNQMYEALERSAITNRLTGLFNYQYFYEQLDDRFQAAKEQGEELSLLLFDIDHFKKYNDLYGHMVGDEVLRQVAMLARQMLCRHDLLLARYGGEEFVAVGRMEAADALALAEELRKMIEQHQFVYRQHTVKNITVSIGLATLRRHGAQTPSELLEQADQALYWGAKEMGRNRTALYSADYDQRLFVDRVTGLHTMHYLRRKLRTLCELPSALPLHFLHVDLRGMRRINEMYGFESGNAVLLEASYLLKNTMRGDDLIARYQDDEFLVIVKALGALDLDNVRMRIQQAFENHRFCGIDGVIGVDLRVVTLDAAEGEPQIWERIESVRETYMGTAL